MKHLRNAVKNVDMVIWKLGIDNWNIGENELFHAEGQLIMNIHDSFQMTNQISDQINPSNYEQPYVRTSNLLEITCYRIGPLC